MNTYDQIVKEAFLDELRNIYAARGEEFDRHKLAGVDVDYMVKSAIFGKALQGLRGAGRSVAAKVSPNQRFIQSMGKIDEGLADTARSALKQQGVGARMEQWGRAARQTPVQRVQAAGLKLAPGEASQITKATEQMGGTTLGKRLVGGAAEGAGAHIAHKSPLGIAINPIGVPLGGAIEGLTRQAGREAVAAGGRAGLAGRTSAAKALGGLGMGAQRHAKKVGLAGEIAGLAGLGTVAHLPLSAAGAVGGKVVGAGAAAAPVLADVAGHALHGLGGAGDVVAHGLHDAVGMASKRAPDFFGRAASSLVGKAPRAVGAVG